MVEDDWYINFNESLIFVLRNYENHVSVILSRCASERFYWQCRHIQFKPTVCQNARLFCRHVHHRAYCAEIYIDQKRN